MHISKKLTQIRELFPVVKFLNSKKPSIFGSFFITLIKLMWFHISREKILNYVNFCYAT